MESHVDCALVFTDIEGSTELWEAHGDAMMRAISVHNQVLGGCAARNQGRVVKTIGDGFFVAFDRALDALRFAVEGQRGLAEADWSQYLPKPLLVRIGVHFGRVIGSDSDYFGPPVNCAARIEAAGHGGQILLSEAALSASGELPSEWPCVSPR